LAPRKSPDKSDTNDFIFGRNEIIVISDLHTYVAVGVRDLVRLMLRYPVARVSTT